MIRRFSAAGAILTMLLLAGCGGGTSAAPKATAKPVRTHTATPVSATVTPTPAPATPTPPPATATATPAASTATPTPQPRATATPQATAPHVTGASLLPASAAPGDSLTAAVTVTGAASQVEMYLSSGPGSNLATYTLSENSAGNWSANVTAPTTPGQYHYTVGVYDFAGRRSIVDQDGWNITVTGGNAGTGSGTTGGSTQANGPQPLPGNLPLAPAFAYNNPVAAVFSADGEQINGSEVASNARSDIAPSTVSGFYLDHLPRAGWTITASPAAGATAFTIVATSGSEVCVVQYSGGSQQIFYGALPSG